MATDFGARLRELRDRAGLSVSRLAQRSGVTQGYLSQIETGQRQNPGASTLVSLATALRCSVDELLGYDVNALPAEQVTPGAQDDRMDRLERLVEGLARTVADRLPVPKRANGVASHARRKAPAKKR